MQRATQGRYGMQGRLGFIATLWMTIVTALLCALAPIGPPASIVTGSAFNPATTSVVVKARSPAASHVAYAMAPDAKDMTPFGLLVIPVVIVFSTLRAYPVPALSPFDLRSRPLALLSARRARAPPAFS